MKNKWFILIIIMMFFASTNFMSKFYYFAFASLFILFVCKRNVKFNYTSIFYLVAGFFMATFHISAGTLAALRCFAGVVCYWLGYNVASGTTLDEELLIDEKEFKKEGLDLSYIMLVVIASGSFVHYILNFFLNIGATDLGRNTIDFWTGEIMSATCQAAFGCVMTGYAMSNIISPRYKFSRIVGLLLVLGIFLYNLVLAGRTLILMMCIIFAIGLIYVIIKEKNASKNNRTFMFFGLALIIIALIILSNIGGSWDYIQNSNLYNRFFSDEGMSVTESGRRDAKIYYLAHMFDHPFGGLHLRESYGTYAHDLILDAYDEFGLVAALLLVVIVVMGIKEMVEFINKKEISTSYKCSFLCVYVAILIEFCVEPILSGMVWLFACYSLINGMVAKLNREYS